MTNNGYIRKQHRIDINIKKENKQKLVNASVKYFGNKKNQRGFVDLAIERLFMYFESLNDTEIIEMVSKADNDIKTELTIAKFGGE